MAGRCSPREFVITPAASMSGFGIDAKSDATVGRLTPAVSAISFWVRPAARIRATRLSSLSLDELSDVLGPAPRVVGPAFGRVLPSGSDWAYGALGVDEQGAGLGVHAIVFGGGLEGRALLVAAPSSTPGEVLVEHGHQASPRS